MICLRHDVKALIATSAVALTVWGCAGGPLTTREKGALGGAALGAGTGAIIGSATGHAGEGAAIGAAIGGLGGGVIGDQIQGQERVTAAQREEIERNRQELARNRQLIEELKRERLDVRETGRGVEVNLPDILFEFGSAALTGDGRRKVARIGEILSGRARDRVVSVEGHTDSIGSAEYNQRLSERRARTVAEALVAEGVSPDLVRPRGFGESEPVAPNQNPDGSDNPMGRAKNRRVEVVILN